VGLSVQQFQINSNGWLKVLAGRAPQQSTQEAPLSTPLLLLPVRFVAYPLLVGAAAATTAAAAAVVRR
jgi:hypothetical protein